MSFEEELLSKTAANSNSKLIFLSSCESTNTYLKRLASNGAESGTVVVADCQTAGKGRLGRTFNSPPGCGIYMSMLFRPDLSPFEMPFITGEAAVLTAKAVEKIIGEKVGIKWVNDLLLFGKKICGILAESTVSALSGKTEALIIGIGLNVLTPKADVNALLSENAGSLYSVTGKVFSRAELTSAIISELSKISFKRDLKLCDYVNQYRERCITLSQSVTVHRGNESYRAYAEDIDSDFGLIVRRDNGELETLSSGEASIRTENGYI